MANMTALQVIQTIGKEVNVPFPSSIANATSPDTLQLITLYEATGRGLRQAKCWPELKRGLFINTQFNVQAYSLPNDYFCSLLDTFWDTTNKWKMSGPLTDSQFNQLLWGYAAFSNREYVRFFGMPGTNQFQVQPPPGTTSLALYFEYISRNWLSPAMWVTGATYVGNTTPVYVNSFGNIYKYTGTSAMAGAAPMNMARGTGQDGQVFWTFAPFTSWTTATAYNAGAIVTNGGNFYICTTTGFSGGGGGPTGTGSTAITDGTVIWSYIATTGWASQTAYARGVYVTTGGRLYLCSNPNIASNTVFYSGSVDPTWTLTTVSDGTIVWTWQDISYENVISDTDFSVFDDELMLLGVKWRWLREHGEDFSDVQQEYQAKVDYAQARWQGSRKITFGACGVIPAGLDPNIQEGNFNFS